MASAPIDPAYALQKAVLAALTGSADLAAIYQGLAKNPAGVPRVYDTPPAPIDKATAPFPYITIGEDTILPDEPQLTDEAIASVYAWSRASDFGEVKLIIGACRLALAQPLAIDGFRTITWKFHGGMPARKEADGLTRRAGLMVSYLVAPVG